MNKLILSTGSDIHYLPKIQPYLDSIEHNSNFDENYLILVDDGDVNFHREKIKLIKFPISNVKCLNSVKCIQHGEFILNDFFIKYSDNDVICFTDGDIILQRSLTNEELNFLRNLKNGDVFVGYNASPTDTLLDESHRLGHNGTNHLEFEYNWSKIKVYNTGVLVMNKITWTNLVNEYITLYPLVDSMFSHYAKQQWLISFIINTREYFNVIEMSYDLHNHRHYPSPVGTRQEPNGDVYFEDKLVLFKHKW